ncbi:hypothetical protein L2E82_12213 [Cichorium intybus]|uniref:Uncharacterized protein n=1 Tax=Cichorium intybus TaxID=13427 RepID=A0ACB9GFG5_CICIN|nr:hypothetical protein L2E82_12213 [Cichorium intybus]
MDITSINNGVWERHVGVFAFPFASHPKHLLNLAQRLASAAPTVVFSFFNTAKSNRALFSELNCDNIRPYDVSDGIPKDYSFVGKHPEDMISLFLTVAEEEYRRAVKLAEEDIGLRISCLVGDAFLWFSSQIAEDMNIPWVSYRTGGTCSLSAHFYTDLIREKSAEDKGLRGPDNEVADLIPGLSTIRLGDLPVGVLFGNLESPFAVMLHKMGRSLPKATAVAINSFQELDTELTKDLSSKFKNFLNVGPSHLISKRKPSSKIDEFSCISWLDTQKPRSVAYISFGTMCKLSPDELVALAETLEDTKTPFLWSLKNDSMKHLPDGFLERTSANGMGKVVAWAPQVQVLDHFSISVFVTHGGWNSVLESIGAGVPMICRPFFGDQQINTWMVERVWGIGVRIEGGNFTKDVSRCALEQILSLNESSKKRKERIEALKELANKAVGPNGSSTRNFETLVDVVTSATL